MDDPLLVGIRFALYAALMPLCGLPAFALYALTTDEQRDPGLLPLRKSLLLLTLAGLTLTLCGLLIMAAAMMGISLFAVDANTVKSILIDTPVGWAGIVRIVSLAVAVLILVGFWQKPCWAYAGTTLFGGTALITLLWNGHAGATDGYIGTIHRISDGLHMLAAAFWIGAIAAFGIMLARSAKPASHLHLTTIRRALDQFGRVGAILVGVIVATGLINSEMIFAVVNWPRLIGTPYGWLLSAKLVAFCAMLLCAAANKWRLTPALDPAADAHQRGFAVAALRRSLVVEATSATLVLALVAWLGTLVPVP